MIHRKLKIIKLLLLAAVISGSTSCVKDFPDSNWIPLYILDTLMNPAPSALTYSGSPYTFTQNLPIAAVTPTMTGVATSCTSDPALPAGLVLDQTTCALSGTPTVSTAYANYLIVASNSRGNTYTLIGITVNPAPVTTPPPNSLSYAGNPFVFTKGALITSVNPTLTGSPSSYSVSPTLPTGLSIDPLTGQLSGTPTAFAGSTGYTVTATYPDASTTTFVLTLSVYPASPSVSATLDFLCSQDLTATLNTVNSGNCTTNTWAYANAYCQIGGFSGAAHVTEQTAGSYTGFYYQNPPATPSVCADLTWFVGYGALSSCTVATEVNCLTAALPAIPAGATLHLKANELMLANGAAVPGWPDASGSGNNGLASLTRIPLLVKPGLNNFPVVRFDGVDDAHEIATMTGDFSTGYSIFVVAKANTTAVNHLNFHANSPFNGLGLGITSSSFDWSVNNTTIASVAADTAWHNFSLIQSGTAATGYMDGAIQGSTIAAPATGAILSFVVGNRSTFDLPWNGDIAEVIYYPSGLSAADRVAVETYLRTKYNLP